MRKQPERLSTVHIRRYALYLRGQEACPPPFKNTSMTCTFFGISGWLPLTKAVLIGGKEELTANHAPASVNSMLAAVGGSPLYGVGGTACKAPERFSALLFCDEEQELARAEVCPAGGYSTAQGGMAIRKYVDYDAISRYALGLWTGPMPQEF